MLDSKGIFLSFVVAKSVSLGNSIQKNLASSVMFCISARGPTHTKSCRQIQRLDSSCLFKELEDNSN